MIAKEKMLIIREIVTIVRPFIIVTDELSAQKNVTLSTVIPLKLA